jgi:hypothetical protein
MDNLAISRERSRLFARKIFIYFLCFFSLTHTHTHVHARAHTHTSYMLGGNDVNSR